MTVDASWVAKYNVLTRVARLAVETRLVRFAVDI